MLPREDRSIECEKTGVTTGHPKEKSREAIENLGQSRPLGKVRPERSLDEPGIGLGGEASGGLGGDVFPG